MRPRRSVLSSWQVLSDLLVCVLGYFMLIAVILIVVPHTPKKMHDGIKPKAEYLVTLTWDDSRNIDLDLWLAHGDCVVFYKTRECPNISLDRDSRGYISNRSVLTDGRVLQSPNQEVVAIRAVMPGDYVASVSYYDDAEQQLVPLVHDPRGAIDATVELVKLNPEVFVVSTVHLHLDMLKQTMNAIAFHVDEDGTVTLRALPPEDMIAQHQSLDP